LTLIEAQGKAAITQYNEIIESIAISARKTIIAVIVTMSL